MLFRSIQVVQAVVVPLEYVPVDFHVLKTRPGAIPAETPVDSGAGKDGEINQRPVSARRKAP